MKNRNYDLFSENSIEEDYTTASEILLDRQTQKELIQIEESYLWPDSLPLEAVEQKYQNLVGGIILMYECLYSYYRKIEINNQIRSGILTFNQGISLLENDRQNFHVEALKNLSENGSQILLNYRNNLFLNNKNKGTIILNDLKERTEKVNRLYGEKVYRMDEDLLSKFPIFEFFIEKILADH